MSEQAHFAYVTWSKRNKVDMQVRTNEQMFVIGFEEGQELIKELADLIFDMEKENKRLDGIIRELRKEAAPKKVVKDGKKV